MFVIYTYFYFLLIFLLLHYNTFCMESFLFTLCVLFYYLWLIILQQPYFLFLFSKMNNDFHLWTFFMGARDMCVQRLIDITLLYFLWKKGSSPTESDDHSDERNTNDDAPSTEYVGDHGLMQWMVESPKYRDTKAKTTRQNRTIERRSRKNHKAPQWEGRWVGKTKIGILKPKVGTDNDWVGIQCIPADWWDEWSSKSSETRNKRRVQTRS